VLGVFQKLLASRATDSHACKMLGALFSSFELAELQRFISDIFGVCLRRLQSNKKVGLQMVACWATFIARFGAPAFRAQLEALQPGLSGMILQSVWPTHAAVAAGVQRKTICISSVRLLCECPETVGEAETFSAVLNAVLLLLLAEQGMAVGAAVDLNAEEEEGIDFGGGAAEGPGYVAAYAQLHFASSAETDLYADKTPLDFMRNSLTQLSAAQPGRLGPMVQAVMGKLPPEKQQGVQALMQGLALS
jgi:exportin-2 (importin alpha re-exporter)